MITYDKLWDTLDKLGVKKQDLVDELGFSKGMIDNLNHNRSITMTTLDDICRKLKIEPIDVLTYVYNEIPDEKNIDDLKKKN